MIKLKFSILCLFISANIFAQLPKGFDYVNDRVPTIEVELRYCGKNNFIGEAVDGYIKNKAILTTQAINGLRKAQVALQKENLSLKIYDAYRPQRAVNNFVNWAKKENDTIMKQQFYPRVDKKDLFSSGYIASKSRHSSGSTVDVTIVNATTGVALDMGSPYDFFGSESWVKNSNLNKEQRKNRRLLQKIMKDSGFRNYAQEWWHFTLKGEPFRNQYFDFLVE